MKSILTLFCVFFSLLLVQSYSQSVPKYDGLVTDKANILSSSTESQLESLAKRARSENGLEVAVLTISDLDGYSIEKYARKVFNSWTLGDKWKNNGVLFLIAKRDREMRIQVGLGLESKLTDSECKKILNREARPSFKEGDYDTGAENVVSAIMDQVQGYGGNRDGNDIDEKRQKNDNSNVGSNYGIIIIAAVVVLSIILGARRSYKRRNYNRSTYNSSSYKNRSYSNRKKKSSSGGGKSGSGGASSSW